MPVNESGYIEILKALEGRATLVAVSKTKPVEDIKALYDLGHRDFGENYVQEMVEKQSQLPGDIRWHFIGHLQSNKVKYISSFVFMIQGVDSLKLLVEINKQAKKHQRVIECLLQMHIAKEETKFGFNEQELDAAIQQYHSSGQLSNIKISGLMGMASFTDNKVQVRDEFVYLKKIFDRVKLKWGGEGFSVLSMGMSSDYQIALEEGSNMVRIGSLIFGERVYNK